MHSCVPEKLYLQEQVVSWIIPVGSNPSYWAKFKYISCIKNVNGSVLEGTAVEGTATKNVIWNKKFAQLPIVMYEYTFSYKIQSFHINT